MSKITVEELFSPVEEPAPVSAKTAQDPTLLAKALITAYHLAEIEGEE